VINLSNSTSQGLGLERYVDSTGGVFFDYPAGLKLFGTDNGEDRLIFGDTREGDTHFLITAYPHVLDGPLTEELIEAQPFAAEFISSIDRVTLPSGVTAFLSQRTALLWARPATPSSRTMARPITLPSSTK
jgi:hypothetical protein